VVNHDLVFPAFGVIIILVRVAFGVIMLVVLMPMLVALTPRVPLRCTIMCAEQPPKASRTTTSSAPNVKSAAKELKSRLEADRERKLHNLFSQPPPTLDAGDDAVSGSHLMERDQLIGVIDSHALLDADEAAGLWPLMLDRDDEARQLAYVDESECIAGWSKCRLGEVVAGLHGITRLHLKASGCPQHS